MFFTFDIALVLLLLVLLLIWIALNKKSASKFENTLNSISDKTLYQSQFRCAIIHPCKKACRMALDLKNKPILTHRMPKLPLPDCDAMACECRFVEQEDRRSGKDRRDLETPSKRLIYGNKRVLKDRRRTSIQEFLLPKYRRYS